MISLRASMAIWAWLWRSLEFPTTATAAKSLGSDGECLLFFFVGNDPMDRIGPINRCECSKHKLSVELVVFWNAAGWREGLVGPSRSGGHTLSLLGFTHPSSKEWPESIHP